MAKNLTKEEYKDFDRQAFVDAYKEFIHEFFKDNYGDIFKVREITLDDYFEQIDEELERYKTFNHVPNYVWTKNAKLDVYVDSIRDYIKAEKIDMEKFSDIVKNGSKYNWQNSLYDELRYFFEFFKMPYITPWVHLKFGDA